MTILTLVFSLMVWASPYSPSEPISQASATDPVILIYWERGYSFDPPPYHLELAAWPDGRVVWCDKPREWVQVNGKWQWTQGKHFEAKIDSEKIKQAVDKVRSTGAFGLKDWNLMPPDASFHKVIVRRGDRGLELSSWRSPSDTPAYGREPAQYVKQLRAWKLVWQLATKLKAEKGRRIKAPDISGWRLSKWAESSRFSFAAWKSARTFPM